MLILKNIFFILSVTVALVYAEDYYELLGVSKDADNRDIRRAFKKLALKLHPDKNQDDKDAHEKFININKVYEVLKDEEMRKKYDLYGEEGLKDDFGKSWKGTYQSWNYYYESFGIYDDDPEIITLSRVDFEQSVLGSPDIWFVNYYSPQCSHCHHLAPAWRAMARELEGVIRIGAVNCEEDWILCRQQNVHSYPTLILYPQREKYRGSRETDSLVEYILQSLPEKVIDLTGKNFEGVISRQELQDHSWIIFICKNKRGTATALVLRMLRMADSQIASCDLLNNECVFDDVIKKLSIILDGLVNVATADIRDDQEICEKISCESMVTYYEDLSKTSEKKLRHVIDETETKSVLNEVLRLLPGAEEITEERFEKIRSTLNSPESHPWLIEFAKSDEDSDASQNTELKRLRAFLPNVHIGRINCQKHGSLCSHWSVRKFPVFIVFKPAGTYEFHHGRFTAHDIATFVRESLSSRVETLSPEDFPGVTDSSQPWFIDFFAPWCPPCMQLLPEWRKASRTVGHLVKFGTVDCTMHATLCNKYNIRSYPTTILYNQSVPIQFRESHTQNYLEDFVKDTLNPLVVSLDPQGFEQLVLEKSRDEMWAIDFFAPWCSPCQQLAPQWRKVAKMMKHDSTIHIGQVDCTKHVDLCHEQNVNSYPTIKLYPKGSKGAKKFQILYNRYNEESDIARKAAIPLDLVIILFNGWNREANSLQAWIYSYLPSKVQSLGTSDFMDVLTDSGPWLVDFFAPWCGHCQIFAPEFEKIAQTVDGKVKIGKVNCEELPSVCHSASISAYPTVKFYSGKKGSGMQNAVGEEINSLTYHGITSYLEDRLGLHLNNRPSHDEL